MSVKCSFCDRVVTVLGEETLVTLVTTGVVKAFCPDHWAELGRWIMGDMKPQTEGLFFVDVGWKWVWAIANNHGGAPFDERFRGQET